MALRARLNRLLANRRQANETRNNQVSHLEPVEYRCSREKLLLNKNDIVFINETRGVIRRIQWYKGVPQQPDFQDSITVEFRNGQTQKYDRRQLTLHPKHLTNIEKLTRYCKRRFTHNTNESVADQIRGRVFLLRLIETSVILIFIADINSFCYGKIMDIERAPNDSSALDIFKIHYVKCGKIYVKYVHQFSSNIALANDKVYTENDCSVFDEISATKNSQLDITDFKCYQLLFQGYYRDVFQEGISNDILYLLIKHIDYSYELVMEIERKTFELEKRLPICTTEISLPPLHPIEIKLRDKLKDRGVYTIERFRAAIKMLRLGLREKEGMYSKLLKEYKITT